MSKPPPILLPGPPTIDELVERRDMLVDEARATAYGDEEITEVFEVGLRDKAKLVRREVRTRHNRTAAAMFWREVRATEARISAIHWKLTTGRAAKKEPSPEE